MRKPVMMGTPDGLWYAVFENGYETKPATYAETVRAAYVYRVNYLLAAIDKRDDKRGDE